MQIIKNNGGKDEKEVVIFGDSLKTGKCGMTPFFTSEKCANKRRRKENVCKNCWMTQ